MPDVTFLLDAPAEPTKRIQIATLGEFDDSRYGSFSIGEDDVASWKQNLAKLPGGRALIDLDHRADRTPRNSEAAGWITGVGMEDGVPVADVEWTPIGEKAITNKTYLFFSPTYGAFKDEKGNVHENTLQGGALTNRPFLSGMPTLTLASEERLEQARDDALELIALDVSQDERDKAKEENNSLPDGSYPIRNVKQLKAAATLAASKHGDWKAAQTLIRRRAKELGVDVTTLPGFGDDGKTLDNAPPEARPLLDRVAAEVENGDSITMMRVLKALEGVPGLNYEGASAVWSNGRARANPQASVAEVLEAGGLNREQITQLAALVATIEVAADAEQQKVREAAPNLERDRVYAGEHGGLPEPVFLPADWDPGAMANKEERARRLARARANDPGALYRGPDGATRFHREDDQAAEVGLDLARGLERRTEVARAKAVAKNETGGIAQPLEAAIAARQGATALESEIPKLIDRIEAEDAERADCKRRGVWRIGLAPHSGELLAQVHEKRKALDDLKQSRAIHLDSVPGFRIALEQPVGWKKLLAAELAGAGPASPFDSDALMTEHEEVDRRARLFLLQNELPAEKYLEAVDAVEAGRDRFEPPAPVRRPAPAPETKLLDDSKGYSPEITARVEEANRFMLENECDFMTALNAVEAGKTTLDQG